MYAHLGSTNATVTHKAQRLQNFAARVSVGALKKYDHISAAFQEFGWLNKKQKLLLVVSIAMYKSLDNPHFERLHFFPTILTTTNSVTGQENNLAITKLKTDTGDGAFSINDCRKWNDIPLDVSNGTTLIFD